MANIILTTMGTGGDVFPFITIGAALKARGHNVTLITNSIYSGAAQMAGLDFAALDNPQESEQMIRDGPLLNTPKGLISFLERHVLPKILGEYEMIYERFSPGATVIVARSEPGLAARIASEQMRAPIVGVYMAPAQMLGLPLIKHLLSTTIGARINDLRLGLGLPAVRQWESWLRYQTSIGLWPSWYCSPGPGWPSGIRLAGFVLSDDPRQKKIDDHIRQALANGESNVLLTAGTGFFGGQDFFKVTVEACRLLGFRVLLLCSHEELLPHKVPDSCIYVSGAPLSDLMLCVSAVCHHGGMGTLGQAIAAGIPQLIMAAGGDRPDNAVRLKALGVAELILPHQKAPEKIAAALSNLISSESVKLRCQYLAARFREISPLDITCEFIESAVQTGRHAGSHSVVLQKTDVSYQ